MGATSRRGGLRNESPVARASRAIRGWLEDGALRAGERFPPELELARRIGVSRFTVHGVLTELAREGAIRPHGRRGWTRPAPGAEGRPLEHTVAVLGAEFGIERLKGLRSRAEQLFIYTGILDELERGELHGLALQVDRAVREGIDFLVASGLRGLVAMIDAASRPEVAAWMEALRGRGLPIAVHGDGLSLERFDTLSSDHAAGAGMLVDWLAALGARRILRFWETHPREGPRPGWLHERDRGYLEGCRRAGLDPLEAYDAMMPSPTYGQDTPESFDMKSRLAESYLKPFLAGRRPVDAIMVVSDRNAFYVARALRALGLEPNRDVPVVGYDNGWSDCGEYALEPIAPAATIDKENAAFGRALAGLIEERRAAGRQAPALHRVLAPRLVVPGEVPGKGRRAAARASGRSTEGT